MTTRNAGSFLSLVAALVAASMLVGCTGEIARLSEKLDDPDPTVRWDAAERLGETGSSEAVDPLIRALADEELSVRNAAAEALGNLGAPAVDPLAQLLMDAEPGIRRLAVFALGESTCPAAAGPLADTLRADTDAAIRAHAATALGALGGEEAETALVAAAAQEKDEKVKQAVTNALNVLRAGIVLPPEKGNES